jgi:hypothetical protein
MFHRLAEQHKLRSRTDPTWQQLLEWLDRLHGWDVSESAIRIGAFSLYIALYGVLSARLHEIRPA